MEKVTLDPAIKFGAGRYRQEKNLLEECGKEISRFGKRAFIIAGNRAWDAVKERIIPGFEKAGLEYELHLYGGKCSYEAAREYAEKCKAENCDEVVGIGGGLVMDFAKAVGEYADTGVVNIPTSIATCAAFTTMSVMYTPEGAKKDCWRFEHEIDAVLVDLQVIAECPIRYAQPEFWMRWQKKSRYRTASRRCISVKIKSICSVPTRWQSILTTCL